MKNIFIYMFILRPMIVRPSAILRAKKDEFVAPTEAPGEGKRRPPTWDEGDVKEVNPIKKFIMKVFKIEEIDHEKFRKENTWAIKINKK
jgi:hypothetical protein